MNLQQNIRQTIVKQINRSKCIATNPKKKNKIYLIDYNIEKPHGMIGECVKGKDIWEDHDRINENSQGEKWRKVMWRGG